MVDFLGRHRRATSDKAWINTATIWSRRGTQRISKSPKSIILTTLIPNSFFIHSNMRIGLSTTTMTNRPLKWIGKAHKAAIFGIIRICNSWTTMRMKVTLVLHSIKMRIFPRRSLNRLRPWRSIRNTTVRSRKYLRKRLIWTIIVDRWAP